MSMTRLNDYISCGTHAARLAFTPTPATPAGGQSPSTIFLETDTGNTYMWNSVSNTWVQLVAGSGGVTGSAAATILFGLDGEEGAEGMMGPAGPSGAGFTGTYNDVTGSRALNTSYTNSTGKVITVYATVTGAGYGSVTVSGLTFAGYGAAASAQYTVTFQVNPGATYEVNGTSVTLAQWVERY